ncbi:HNH endonuclease [Vibrio vulnificus]|uniref:HNH endonuclease n=1 Tax=Vibrio vulnificus TaxID=672 RepID=UPI0009B682C3|nr:HNH endonuclease [Vibrio vulnificus]EGQ7694977.1 HNH endonuclease [Vibrio vulnificus]EHU4929437.1 HNH endonuclease [Vibrio vulnificus]EIT7023290.1 HNH endonuclease [Vibrio vulnificus]EIV8621643.1 HNH endonuclease [Vibrio vulnificus]EKA7346442.1 HNH endonuclease [Vibrio vulnificus]
MRPFKKGSSPVSGDYSDYSDAKTNLISRFSSGMINGSHKAAYCSYCERVITQSLAVEHIQPKKGKYSHPTLIGRWDNFLLACVNCNSAKGSKGVFFDYLLFPDRDNTFKAFIYEPDGKIYVNKNNNVVMQSLAINTLRLTGLDKTSRKTFDENGKLIAQDRINQRMEAWGTAEVQLNIYLQDKHNVHIREMIAMQMVTTGYFSVWMTVFSEHDDMKKIFVDSISGTRASGCFDQKTHSCVHPHDNPDRLPTGRFSMYK